MLALPFTPLHTLLLLVAGWLLITVEFNRPGRVLPGAAGLLALLLGIASALRLPEAPLVLGLLMAAAGSAWLGYRRASLWFVLPTALFLTGAYLVLLRPSHTASRLLVAPLLAVAMAVTTAVLTQIAHRARVAKGLD